MPKIQTFVESALSQLIKPILTKLTDKIQESCTNICIQAIKQFQRQTTDSQINLTSQATVSNTQPQQNKNNEIIKQSSNHA